VNQNLEMKTYTQKFLFLICLFFWTIIPSIKAEGGHGDSEKFNPKDMIMHHVMDSYEWHILDYKDANGEEHSVSIPLPVILFTDGSLDIFMSSAFHHGKEQVIKGTNVYRMDEHGHIKEANGKKIIDLSITKNVASMLISAIILIWVFTSVAKAYVKQAGKAPKGAQNFFEMIIVFIRDEVVIPNIGEKHYKKYLPYLLTLFFFIWTNNLLGLIPGGANASGNIAFTMTLAVITFLVTNISGNKEYWGHIFWTPGVPKPLMIILAPIEFIGIFTKPFALMIRLFANITGGHIIILSLVSFAFIFKSMVVGFAASAGVVVMMFLELFVAALQSYIFTLLTSLFIGMAIAEHEHEHEHAEHH
jgi:F-type H+-transporting ATPase subunit a